VPDGELVDLYRGEARVAADTQAPFLSRLPFSVLYAAGEDGPIATVHQAHDKAFEREIEHSWTGDTFGGFTDGTLCSLSRLEVGGSPLELTAAYVPCRYAQSLATVLSPDRCPRGNLTRSLRRELLAASPGRLPALGDRGLSAHAAVTAVVLTADRIRSSRRA
jgi:hypothetical protein